MFIGRGNLGDVLAELERQRASKFDFVADNRSLKVSDGEKCLLLQPRTAQAGEWLDRGGLPIREDALRQLGGRLDPEVPGKFLAELVGKNTPLASTLVNGLLEEGDRHLVRCLDGRVRAFLSNRYRVIDNYDIAFAALDAVKQHGGTAIEARLTDKAMRLTFTDWSTKEVLEGVVKRGGRGNHRFESLARDEGGQEVIHPYVSIANSETGNGGYNVAIGILLSACCNGCVVEKLHSQIHLGETLEVGRWSEATRSAEAKTIILKCQDVIKTAFSGDAFKRMVQVVNKAVGDTIVQPTVAVDNLIANTDLTEESKSSILEYFLKDYDQTRYGLAQAVSRYSQDLEDADRASEVEELAGKVLVGSAKY